MKLHISDEMINAFIDDELDQQDKSAIKEAMQNDVELRRRIENLCALKKAVKLSYQQLPVTDERSSGNRSIHASWMQHVAMVSLMVIGLVFGWLIRGGYESGEAGLGYVNAVQLDTQAPEQASKIILHVSSSEPAKLNYTLHKVSEIIEKYSRHQMDFEIEVVANAGGIDLLREDVSPYKKEIVEVMKNYQNVTFIACNNAIDRLRLQGIEPRLITHTRTGVTAVDQIVKRLQQGWVYLKV
ncbi:MAG: hypothetical protein OQL09_03695 [Gammaproteobacteria bacterium]|nr:hypothetical protein [Gammaproteobacteria bacterium]